MSERAAATARSREPEPLPVEPVLQLGRRARHVEPLEQRPAVERERALGVARRQRLRRVPWRRTTPPAPARHLLVAAADHDLGADLRPQEVERAAERGARVLLVELRPEQGEQRVAAVKPPWRGHGEVGQQPEPLRLLEDRAQLAAVRVPEVQYAERVKADHEAGGIGGGALRGHRGGRALSQWSRT